MKCMHLKRRMLPTQRLKINPLTGMGHHHLSTPPRGVQYSIVYAGLQIFLYRWQHKAARAMKLAFT
jgi:hypothetical protein